MNDHIDWKPVRVPVILVDGQWEFFYGGKVPVREGAFGELHVDKGSIVDNEFLSSLKRKNAYKILGAGTELLVALTVKSEPKLKDELNDNLLPPNSHGTVLSGHYYLSRLSQDTQFVKIRIAGPTDRQKNHDPGETGGVWLQLEGFQAKGLTSSMVNVPPEVSKAPADSLNHAFTLLSEKYEPWRKSHTGNIYARIFYQETNQRWYPLDVLRNAAMAEDEHQFVREQWDKISKQLNIQPNDYR